MEYSLRRGFRTPHRPSVNDFSSYFCSIRGIDFVVSRSRLFDKIELRGNVGAECGVDFGAFLVRMTRPTVDVALDFYRSKDADSSTVAQVAHFTREIIQSSPKGEKPRVYVISKDDFLETIFRIYDFHPYLKFASSIEGAFSARHE